MFVHAEDSIGKSAKQVLPSTPESESLACHTQRTCGNLGDPDFSGKAPVYPTSDNQARKVNGGQEVG